MNLKSTTAALAEALERDEDYAEECEVAEVAGRRHEAASTRTRVERLKKAQDEIASLVAMARTIVESNDTGSAPREKAEKAEKAWDDLRELAKVTP